jgi:acyl-CoA thioester hydrolase
MARTDFRFAHPLRVRWAEVDKQGIVFNGHYLLYFDVGITEYWRATGFPYPQGLLDQGSDLYVVKSTVEYHRSAEYDDELEVCVRVARIGRSSMNFAIEIHRGGDHLVSGEVIYVNADPATRTSAPVPAQLRERIAAFEGRDPTQ